MGVRFNFPVCVLFSLGFSCLSLASSERSSVYSFGGACSSLGSWSQSALSQTQAIIQIVEALKDNPDCKGLETIIPKIRLAEQQMSSSPDEAQRVDRLESIPKEISSLRNMAIAAPDVKADALQLLATRTLEGATLSAEAGVTGTSAAALAGTLPVGAVADGAKRLEAQIRRASLTGLEMLNQTMAILPQFDRCLIGRPNQGLALIGAAVKLSASFASSEDAVASKLGDSIAGLVTMLRNKKFTKVLRNLDETQFWLSLSCLLETTSQSYCAARDARAILQFGIRELRPQPAPAFHLDNPLEGYYVLTRDVPNISQWLQRIQFGISPKLSTDATFKNRVWANVTNLITEINYLRGLFSEQMLTYSTLQDITSRRNALLKLVKILASRMGGGAEAASEDHLNFFALSVFDELIPFKLIGLDVIPAECAANDTGKFMMPWDAWMQAGGQFVKEFHNPDNLAKIIGQRLEWLIDQALTKASLYFQQRLIVDMPNLVTESVTSQTITVVQSLNRIESYLARLEKKVVGKNEDLILIPNIRNTRTRIRRVLKSYQMVRDLVSQLPDDPEDDKFEEQIKEGYKRIVETAYEEFNILLQRDTFLSSRLGTFIHFDYATRIKSREDMSKYEEELLRVSGRDLLTRVLFVTGDNPTNSMNDLASAQVVNKRNLRDIEVLFRDSLYPVIEELDGIAKGYNPHTLGRELQKGSRSLHSYVDGFIELTANPLQRQLAFLWAFQKSQIEMTAQYLPTFGRFFYPASIYSLPVSTKRAFAGADDEFGSFEQFRSKLCVQTLAFENRKYFEPVCRGAILKSAFDLADHPRSSKFKLNVMYDEFLSDSLRNTPVQGDSICAFQQYNRRNLVYWLTQDLAGYRVDN